MSTAVEQIIKPYHETNRFSLFCGDCRDVMRSLADNSVDAIVTDPPYELTSNKKGGIGIASLNLNSPAGRARATTGFMGKAWDGTGVPFMVETWIEALRVLKPGGHLLAFGGSRTYHRLACAIEDAGFEIRDQIQWIYSSGFPKSLNLSKAIDATGQRFQFFAEVRALLLNALQVSGLSHKQVNERMGYATNGSGMAGHWFANESQQTLPTKEQWFRLQEILGFDNRFDEIFNACVSPHERPIIGFHSQPATSIYSDRSLPQTVALTAAATAAAKQWNGWGTALKPAHEPIVLARKPLIGTVAENVLQHGTGGLNIDGCRVPTDETLSAGSRRLGDGIKYGLCEPTTEYSQNTNGRWPSNIIHDGSDEVLAAFPDAPGQQGDLNGHSKDRLSKGIFGDMKAARDAVARLDSGSAARFFYCAKATQEDRNEGCESLPHRVADDVHKRPRTELDDPRRHGVTPRQNNHPTVKPTELMRYLCRLITPPSGTVLDPFCGSGSTGKAAMLEGFKFVGVELSADYCQLAQRRIEAVTRQGLLFA